LFIIVQPETGTSRPQGSKLLLQLFEYKENQRASPCMKNLLRENEMNDGI
jgi:hypothetical protein